MVITWLSWRHRFRKASFSKGFLTPTLNAKLKLKNSAGLRRNFRKAPFSWRINVDDRPNRRNNAVSDVVWQESKATQTYRFQQHRYCLTASLCRSARDDIYCLFAVCSWPSDFRSHQESFLPKDSVNQSRKKIELYEGRWGVVTSLKSIHVKLQNGVVSGCWVVKGIF